MYSLDITQAFFPARKVMFQKAQIKPYLIEWNQSQNINYKAQISLKTGQPSSIKYVNRTGNFNGKSGPNLNIFPSQFDSKIHSKKPINKQANFIMKHTSQDWKSLAYILKLHSLPKRSLLGFNFFIDIVIFAI